MIVAITFAGLFRLLQHSSGRLLLFVGRIAVFAKCTLLSRPRGMGGVV
jgi:hypothetical protein